MAIFNPMRLRGLLLGATILASPLIVAAPVPAAAQLAIGISVQIAPPMLPVYVQPPMPDLGYIWTPGFWSWANPVGYYWVPGTWVQPPIVGVLWTPPYWGWSNGGYGFHEGYWGPHVGFYGGINYGFGYGGNGYEGGRWDGGQFAYNRTVNNFGSVRTTNVYENNVTVINNNHVAYVGGTGGLRAEPGAEDRAAAAERHLAPTTEQTTHVTTAARNPELAANRNNGHPAVAATSRPAQFDGPGVVRAVGAPEHPAAAAAVRPTQIHPVATNAAPAHAAPALRAPQPGAPHPAPGHPVATNAAPAHPTATHAALVQKTAARPTPVEHAAAAAPAHAAAAPAAPAQSGKEKKPAT